MPHNPMINSGAIMATALIAPSEPLHARFEYVMKFWHELAGRPEEKEVQFNNSVCLSERATADRNFCLAYLMVRCRRGYIYIYIHTFYH